MARLTITAGIAPSAAVTSAAPHRVAVLALDSVVPFDLGIACDMFGMAPGEPRPYAVSVCGERRRVRTRYMSLALEHGLAALAEAQTVVVPGVDPQIEVRPAVLDALRRAAARGARVASICTGAYVLAAAGLLDGRRAATHWRFAEALAQRFPAVEVDAAALFVDEGAILTSAGVAAGADLCLHMIRLDHGAAYAAQCARNAVLAPERHGGQAQFLVHAPPASPASLAPLLAWMEANTGADQSLEALAARAGMSVRTLVRRFREQTGVTPLRWTTLARVRQVQAALETTDRSVEQIAHAVGFGSPSNLRQRFAETVGVSPAAYRRQFGGGRRAAA